MGIMINPKLRDLSDPDDPDGRLIAHDCPACCCRHYIPIGVPGNPEDPRWTFDPEGPSFSPSVNIGNGTCHYYITDGKIIYQDDSRHALAGMTLTLPDLKGY